MRLYYTLAVWRFKPFLSVGFAGTFAFIWRFTVQKLLAVSGLRKKALNESGLRSRKKKLWRFAECATSYNDLLDLFPSTPSGA